ncbi:hypothetical protein G6F56_013792 [Rhizopus delemar]|nr:hypothetical protein G6F56_013792 [Rhizopus delemar]
MKSTSWAPASGSSGKSSRGVSVVPTMVWPFHGTTHSTRPSSVLGIRMARLPGRKSRGKVRCTPWLGATIVGAFLSSMRRTASTQTPVALITQRARSEKLAPPMTSCAVTPSTLPLVVVKPVART